MTAFCALVFSIFSRAAVASFQKSGAEARASSPSKIFRRLSTSKIASHFHQPFAQLEKPRYNFFNRYHVPLSFDSDL